MWPYNYINSAVVGPYYELCCDLGYPQIDVIRYNDGEWALIEYINAPLIPSLTQYRHIAIGLKNKEINKSNIQKIILDCDPTKKKIWEREEQKSKKIESEHKSREEHRESVINEAVNVMKRNPDLMERVAKNGLSEIDLPAIAKNIDPAKLQKRLKEQSKC